MTFSWIERQKETIKTTAKAGGAVIGGGSFLTFILWLHGDIKSEIANAEERSKKYTDSKIGTVESNVQHLKAGQSEIKTILLRLDDRLYKLNSGK